MSKWHKTADKFPLPGEEVEITHPQFRGTRTAKMDTLLCPHWLLTDCTHPEQNCYIPMEGSAWRSLSDKSERSR